MLDGPPWVFTVSHPTSCPVVNPGESPMNVARACALPSETSDALIRGPFSHSRHTHISLLEVEKSLWTYFGPTFNPFPCKMRQYPRWPFFRPQLGHFQTGVGCVKIVVFCQRSGVKQWVGAPGIVLGSPPEHVHLPRPVPSPRSACLFCELSRSSVGIWGMRWGYFRSTWGLGDWGPSTFAAAPSSPPSSLCLPSAGGARAGVPRPSRGLLQTP